MLSYTDYYAHGSVMPGRNYVNSFSCRYDYQGQEKDGETGFNNFELRMYDARYGRWFNPDPMDQHHSPYLAMSNNPVSHIDPTGGYDYVAENMYPADWYNMDIMQRSEWLGQNGFYNTIDAETNPGYGSRRDLLREASEAADNYKRMLRNALYAAGYSMVDGHWGYHQATTNYTSTDMMRTHDRVVIATTTYEFVKAGIEVFEEFNGAWRAQQFFSQHSGRKGLIRTKIISEEISTVTERYWLTDGRGGLGNYTFHIPGGGVHQLLQLGTMDGAHSLISLALMHQMVLQSLLVQHPVVAKFQ